METDKNRDNTAAHTADCAKTLVLTKPDQVSQRIAQNMSMIKRTSEKLSNCIKAQQDQGQEIDTAQMDIKVMHRQLNEDEALLKSLLAATLFFPATATEEYSTATATEESPTQVPSADDQDGIATESSTKRLRLAKGVNDEQASFDKTQQPGDRAKP